MRSTLEQFQQELHNAELLLSSIKPAGELLATHQAPWVSDYRRVRRIYDHAAFVVLLYASFERFVENLVAECAVLASRRVPYSDLPEGLRSKHRSKTLDLVLKNRVGEGRLRGLNESDFLKNLLDCLRNESPYALNREALIAHDSNLRTKAVDELFAGVGLPHACVAATLAMHAAIRDAAATSDTGGKVMQTGEALAELSHERVRLQLEELVSRRNDIAHGGIQDIPSVEAMLEQLAFIKEFSAGLFAVAAGGYLAQGVAAAAELLQVTERAFKNSVVVVERPTIRLVVGQPVFALVKAVADGAKPVNIMYARWGRVKELRADGLSVVSTDAAPAGQLSFGVSLGFCCPEGATLYALDKDDNLIWSPP